VDLEFLSLPSPLANYRIRPSQLAAEKLTATSTAQQLAAHNETLSAFGQDLSGSPVNYLFRSERRKLVMLGNHIFEPGDPLTPTVNLHDIQPNALILKLNPSASNPSPATQRID
jgi:hypothetical protein